MHLAITSGYMDIVNLLLTENTTLETLDYQRMNGLHYATLRYTLEALDDDRQIGDLYREDDQ